MATRPAWKYDGKRISKDWFSFEFNPGFAVSQKKKNVVNLHESIGKNALEISTKSESILGKKLSAFNLCINGIPLECIFQASKVYENGGPYLDLLNVSPKDAKRDPRHKTSGKLIYFKYNNEIYPIEPKTVFYDYIYVMAVRQCFSLTDLGALKNYIYFTDIEFNPNKSINCQAEAVALIKALISQFGEIPKLDSPNGFKDFSIFYKIMLGISN